VCAKYITFQRFKLHFWRIVSLFFRIAVPAVLFHTVFATPTWLHRNEPLHLTVLTLVPEADASSILWKINYRRCPTLRTQMKIPSLEAIQPESTADAVSSGWKAFSFIKNEM